MNEIYINGKHDEILIWKENSNIYIDDNNGNTAIIKNIDWSFESIFTDIENRLTHIYATEETKLTDDDYEYDIFNLPTSKEDALSFCKQNKLDVSNLNAEIAGWSSSEDISNIQTYSTNEDTTNINTLIAQFQEVVV